MTVPNAIRGHKHLLSPALATPPLYVLPEHIAEKVHLVTTLAAVQLGAPALSPWEATMATADKMLAEPEGAAKLATDMVTKAERATRDLEVRGQALNRAREVADMQLSSVVADGADELLAAIRAAGEPVWSDIEQCRDALAGVETASAEAILRSGEEAREAWLRLGERAMTYQQLRHAASAIVWDEPVQWDTRGCHREWPDGMCRLVGVNWYGSPMADGSPTMPWPVDASGAQRLLWFARQGAKPHWVSPEEQDRAWQAAHADQHQAAISQQSRHAQAHAWGSRTG